MKIIIVGGVAGGASAAARLRRLSEKNEIIVMEKGEHISFANCGLPYYIGGEIKERDALLLQTPEAMQKRFAIDVRINNEVLSIDREQKKVRVKNLLSGQEYEESYDKLLLSPGARPFVPPIKGLEEAENVFTLRNIPDTDKIKTYIENQKPKTAVIIGAGFIGVEMAENLVHAGVKVHLVEMADQVMAPLDKEMAAYVHNEIRMNGVHLVLGNGIDSFAQNGKEIILKDGTRIATDMTILAIGVTPENDLAKKAGLEIGDRGGIKVKETMQTTLDEDIYAVGDAVEVKGYLHQNPAMIPLAWPANRQGRLAADHICGRKVSYIGSLGTAVAKVFDMTVASTGDNEKNLKRLGIEYKVIHTHPNSHASYYPGAETIHLKVIYQAQTLQILGAQAVGAENGVKAIDVIATAIKGKLTVTQLQELELAYAPPYSSAKAPVNFLGYVAENLEENLVQSFQWHEVDDLIANGQIILDVREEAEYELGHIKTAIHIPVGELRNSLDLLPKDKKISVYCKVGVRGYLASRILLDYGFDVQNLDGGYDLYSVTLPQEEIDENDETLSRDTMEKEEMKQNTMQAETLVIDACGLQCPGPIMQVYKGMDSLKSGDFLKISVTDAGFTKDIKAWCKKTGNTLISIEKDKKAYVCLLQKSECGVAVQEACRETEDGATLVVFSGDLDKAMASFIIASGAASMGKKVTMFFTFWGLNVIKKTGVHVPKQGMEKMFSAMLPKDASGLPLSKMNMGGMGAVMMKKIMKEKNVESLPMLIHNAMEMGVKIIACSMSMDVMGIRKEELIDGVEIGGVATYLGKTNDSNLNLFI